MSEDKELAIKLQFLEEAAEYLNTIESVLLSFSTNPASEQMNAALRAAHSIKGGAAMMGFEALSNLAHRVEDFFKVLKAQKDSLNDEVERLLLLAVDYMRQVIDCYLQFQAVPEEWLTTTVNPVFDYVHQQLGEPPIEDLIAEMPETGHDMVALIFETEVEGCLQRLESIVADPQRPCLFEEVSILAQQFAGLGEMLELAAFTSLCNSITKHLEANPEQINEIANLALQAWRRCQALIQIGQIEILPNQIDFDSSLPTDIDIINTTAIEPREDAYSLHIDLEQLLADDHESGFDSFINLPVTTEYNLPTEADIAELQNNLTQLLVTTNDVLDAALVADFPPENNSLTRFEPEFKLPLTTNITTADSQIVPLAPISEHQLKVTPFVSNLEKIENTVRVPFKQLTQLNDLFGELTIERNSLALRLDKLRNLFKIINRKIQILEQSNLQLRSAYDKVATKVSINASHTNLAAENLIQKEDNFSLTSSTNDRKFDSLEMDQYNDLHLLSQEVMETIVQIQEVKTDIELNLEDTEQTIRELNRTAKQMQTGFNQLRMRPLSDIVGRFPRALRDLCLKHGKNVELKIQGSETLIERTILEALSDPLMHLLRNAFDHGIESPETRLACGKLEQGTIEIRAQIRGNKTLITVSDDGGGIPIDKIQQKAEQMGLDAADLAAVSSQQLLELIFEPGFSTADNVTTLSGRGVGMDVVRTNIKQIHGDIQVDTKLGIGTTFTISVPFTLSVMRVLIVESNGMLLAFPKDAIEEMILSNPELILNVEGNEVLNWEECLIPLINLSQFLEFYCPHKPIETEGMPTISEPVILLVSQGDNLSGVKIERCWGEQEVAIRQVEGAIALPSVFSGCTILGDGRIVPLVDILGLFDLINNKLSIKNSVKNQLTQSDYAKLPPSPTTVIAETSKNAILVVDDSINVRRYLALTLEKAGYQVEQAKDGQDAFEKLLKGLRVQAVVCDIEMPRLDGYSFLGKIKSNAAFSQIPVAMLTSRSGNKHRQIAMNLGAAAYLSKPYKETELLETMSKLVTSNSQG